MNETSIARQSVPDQVARAILDFLKRNGYEPGDKIPTTKAMCEHFEVGYPTLREAIQQLETLGFVRVRHGSGIYVESLEERLFVANPMEVKLSPKVLLDLIQARKAIEPLAASLAAMWASDEEIERMRETLDRAASHIHDDRSLRASNMDFHAQVAQSSGNLVFGQIMTVLTQFFAKEQEAILAIHAGRDQDHQEHVAIFEAIERRDPIEAQQLMTDHLEGVEEVLRRYFAAKR